MKTTKLPYLIFSLAMLTALILSAIPVAPAHALSDSAVKQGVSIEAASNSPVLTSGIVVCRTKIVWHHGHRTVVRVCHRVHRPDAQ